MNPIDPLSFGPFINYTFQDNFYHETSFIVEGATSPNGPFTPLEKFPAHPGTGQVRFGDFYNSGATYFRVYALNGGNVSSYSSVAALVP